MRSITTLFAVIVILATAHAQESIFGELVESNGQFETVDANFENYEIYRIQIQKQLVENQSSSFLLDLHFGNRTFKLNLFKDNLTTSFVAENKPVTLGGSLYSGGSVSLTINDGFIFGFIQEGNSKYYIEPLRRLEKSADSDLFLFYHVDDVIDTGEHICGSDLVDSKTPKLPDAFLKMPTTACKIVDYAIANTFDMIAAIGGGTTGVMNFNIGVLNDVQTNYRSEFDTNLEYDVVANYVSTSTANNPYEPQTSSTNGSTLLFRFREWARGPGNAGGGNTGGATGGFGVDYNMAGVWTDTDFSGGVVGIAYTPGWHHILENYTSSAASLNAMVSHEIGHNWNAPHVGSCGNNNIMAPCVTLTDIWAASTKTTISTRIASQGYLDNCSVIGPPIADFFQGGIAGCTGSTISFEDQSQYGATRTWDFITGTPPTSTSEKPTITFNTVGLHPVTITSTNGAGSDTEVKYVDIQAAPPTPCTPSGTGGSAGITLFRLTSINNSSTTTGVYEDFSCDGSAVLDESTTYSYTLGVQGVTRLRYFFDYNDDGDFNDTGESSSQYTLSNPNGTYNVSFTTPSAPVQGQLLRMRVTVSTTSIASGGCTTPSAGQVEDYSLYFEAPQVYGCTDPAATNYDPTATIDDGSCTYGSITWYRDFDSDNFGDPNISQQSASQPAGYVVDDTDCDDNDANAFPGNPEVCDGVDNDCDGNIDNGVLTTYYRDFDSDNFGDPNIISQACTQPIGFVSNNDDCDDNDPLEFPDQIWYRDFDNDLHGNGINIVQCTRPAGYFVSAELISVDLDCNDDDPTAFPGNPEVCDGVDNDCNDIIDDGVLLMFFRDFDNDNYGDIDVYTQACTQPIGYVTNDLDCNDNDPLEFPGQVWYLDEDGDAYGEGTSLVNCTRPTNYYVSSELISTNSDCNDNDASINPGEIDVCGDGIDNDCSGQADEGCGSPPDCDAANLVIPVITQNEYRAELGIESDALVDNGQSVLFTAGTQLDFESGFEVVAGTLFEAIIAPCFNGFDGPENDDVSKATIVLDLEELSQLVLEDHSERSTLHVFFFNKYGEEIIEFTSEAQSFKTTIQQKLNTLDKGHYLIMVNYGDKWLTMNLMQ